MTSRQDASSSDKASLDDASLDEPSLDEALKSAEPVPGHAGDIAPKAAWDAAKAGARLVDVRTDAEWRFVGLPDLSEAGQEVGLVEWVDHAGTPNETFLEELGQTAPSRETPVLFLCRSGVRSAHAARAATKAGYARAYNIADGFEGPLDGESHRGRVAGWKADGLAWRQG